MSIIESIRHPGYAEAHAAGVAMTELYGSPAQGEGRWVNGRLVSTYAVGDSVNVAFPDGHRRCVVIEVLDANRYHVVEHLPGGGRRHHEIDGDAIAAF
jgi:prepilin-type processing-associated H-X9-DG protein